MSKPREKESRKDEEEEQASSTCKKGKNQVFGGIVSLPRLVGGYDF